MLVGSIHKLSLLLREKEMSGHSSGSTIKRKKAQRMPTGKTFTKIIKKSWLQLVWRRGYQCNPRLRSAVLAAKAENMPKDNIDRAIKKGPEGWKGSTMKN